MEEQAPRDGKVDCEPAVGKAAAQFSVGTSSSTRKVSLEKFKFLKVLPRLEVGSAGLEIPAKEEDVCAAVFKSVRNKKENLCGASMQGVLESFPFLWCCDSFCLCSIYK